MTEPAAAAPVKNTVGDTSLPKTPKDPLDVSGEASMMQSGYSQKLAGVKGEAKASAQQAATEQATLDAAAKTQQDAFNQYQQKSNALLNERAGLQQAVQNAQINPNQLFDNQSTFQKIQTGIGLFLGGLGAGIGHTNNQALDFLNKQIDRDIASQQANLDKKKGLLAANAESLGDVKDAAVMTKLMMQDHVQTQLQQAAAKSNSALVQARANQAIGDIKMQQAPLFQQLAMRQSLMDTGATMAQPGMMQQMGAPGQQPTAGGMPLRQVDPSIFLQTIPDKEDRTKAGVEIERATNTRKMSNDIMNSFEEAANDYSGAGNKALSVLKTPRSVGALHQAMQPTFADLEGTVRQAAMDNTFSNITPNAMDTEADIEKKRNALQQYIRSKASAPFAKSHGIDLDKFATTNTMPEARLNPQQQSFLTWARQNPGNPKAQAIFKKLGISQ